MFVAVGRREPGPRSPADTYRLVLLQSTALVTLFLSLLPIVLEGLGATDDLLWRLSSGILAVALTVMLIGTQKLRRRHDAEIREGEQRAVAAGIWVASCVLLAAQVPNVLGWFGARAFGVFFLALVFLVAFGSYLFARMLFLWRS